MAKFICKTRKGENSQGKPRVYFTCHPQDFSVCFKKITEDILAIQDCAIYYTEDGTELMTLENKEVDLAQINLFVVPVTRRLLTEYNRAMAVDIEYAKEKHIPILPLMMETGLDHLYAKEENFGERQYLQPYSTDLTEIRYEDKLKNYLNTVLISEELARRVRAAFDAYIFLSYRKKDRRYANELMKMIHANPECRDIAIWYDEFLTPGESFNDGIRKILADSKLFTLLVTPSLLEEPDGVPNYVMAHEYPEAVNAGKAILPAEMEKTDGVLLKEKYVDIPECVNPYDDEGFRERLLETLKTIAIAENNQEPEHNFLIGLAYLEGIDVEIDRTKGIELIKSAAEAGLPEAMTRIMRMFWRGEYLPKDYDQAIAWGTRLLEQSVECRGTGHETTTEAKRTLANIYYSAGQYQKAETAYEEAYEWHIEAHGEDNQRALELLNEVAGVHRFNSLEKAVEARRKIYEIASRIYGPEHKDTICILGRYAEYCSMASEHKIALTLYRLAYDLSLRTLGETDMTTVILLHNLAMEYLEEEDYNRAKELLLQAYGIVSQYHKEERTELTIVANLGLVSGKLGDYPTAIQYYEKAYWEDRETFGSRNFDNSFTRKKIVELYQQQGDYRGLLDFQKKVYEHQARILGADSDDAIRTLMDIASAYVTMQEYTEAVNSYKKAYESAYSVFEWNPKGIFAAGPRDVMILQGMAQKQLAETYALMGETEKAQFVREQIAVFNNLTFVRLNRNPFVGFGGLSAIYRECQDYEKALELGEAAYIEACKTLGAMNTKSLSLLDDLAVGFYVMGYGEKAIEYMSHIVDVKKHYLEKDHPYTLSAMMALSVIYKRMGYNAKAEEIDRYLKKLEDAIMVNLDGTFIEVKQIAWQYEDSVFCRGDKLIEIYEKLYQLACREKGENSQDAFLTLRNLVRVCQKGGMVEKAVDLLKKLHSDATQLLGENYHISKEVSAESVKIQLDKLQNGK